MALVAALAMQEGHRVQVYDANAWRAGDDVLRQVLQADDWDVVATGGITTTYGYVKKICQFSKELCPDSVLVVGGGLLTSIPRDIMRLLPQIDIGVIGEAFVTFNQILAQVDGGESEPRETPGIIFRKSDGSLQLSEQRELLQEIDALPYPAYDLFPLEEVYFPNSQALYSEEGMMATRRLDINASYGCSLVCKFCFHLGISGDMKYTKNESGQTDVTFDQPRSYTRSIRYHSARYVVDMVKHLRDKYGVDFIGFLDENLMTMHQFSGKTWLKEICGLWIAEGLQPQCVRDGVEHSEDCTGVHWAGTSHASLSYPEILKSMREAGCSHLVYGYESFSPQILRRLGKGATRDTNIKSFFATMEVGIRPIPNQIMGFPTEDFDSLRESMKAWEELGIVVKPFFATPYPGSFWYQVYKDRVLDQYGGDLESFLLELGDATEVTGVISENFNPVELYGLRELMLRFDYKRLAEYEEEWKKRNPQADAIKKAEDREKERMVEIIPLS